MTKKILWIDDDYYAIQGLFRSIEKSGIKVISATSALDGYRKAQKWKEYDLIVVDLILPIAEHQETVPDIVKTWEDEYENAQVGVGMVKWLLQNLEVTCPVVILSVVPNPLVTYGLTDLAIKVAISKGGLLPSDLYSEIMKLIKEA
jgi:CheY-like chemotaxis protein